MTYWAHPGQELKDHLEGVALLAQNFASDFDSADWGRLAGLWHDLGKYTEAFQRRIRGEDIRAPHAGAGAVAAMELDQRMGLPLAFAIAGHHAGLANWQVQGGTRQRALCDRLREDVALLDDARDRIPPELLRQALPEIPAWAKADCKSLEFWTRFLFSALVDADWLDTERSQNPARHAERGTYPCIGTLLERLDAFIAAKVAGLPPEQRDTPVNEARRAILDACRVAALWTPGLFSLTAPTGGGKTLSAMVFTLRHAAKHWLCERFAAILKTMQYRGFCQAV